MLIEMLKHVSLTVCAVRFSVDLLNGGMPLLHASTWKHVEELWDIWCADSEEYLCKRAAAAGHDIDRKQCLGRGTVRFKKRQVGMPCDGQQAACTAKCSKLGKLKRRLVDLLRQVVAHSDAAVARKSMMQQLWKKCRRRAQHLMADDLNDPIWQSVAIPSGSNVQHLIDSVKGGYSEASAAGAC